MLAEQQDNCKYQLSQDVCKRPAATNYGNVTLPEDEISRLAVWCTDGWMMTHLDNNISNNDNLSVPVTMVLPAFTADRLSPHFNSHRLLK